MNYITETKFFNTGPIRSDMTELRAKQGLEQQNISNTCNNYNKLYPQYQTPLPTYGLKYIPDAAICVKYIQPP